VKFEFRHVLEAPVERVIETMFGDGYFAYLGAHMKLIEKIEPLERSEDERTIRRRTLYRPVPIIKSVGPKRVPPEWMAFTEVSTFDKKTRELRFENVPLTGPAKTRLTNQGVVRFVPAGADRTTRLTEGELKVKVMLLGVIAERVIASEAQKLLDEEARVLNQLLRERAAAPPQPAG
jgi:hypothetical protein